MFCFFHSFLVFAESVFYPNIVHYIPFSYLPRLSYDIVKDFTYFDDLDSFEGYCWACMSVLDCCCCCFKIKLRADMVGHTCDLRNLGGKAGDYHKFKAL